MIRSFKQYLKESFTQKGFPSPYPWSNYGAWYNPETTEYVSVIPQYGHEKIADLYLFQHPIDSAENDESPLDAMVDRGFVRICHPNFRSGSPSPELDITHRSMESVKSTISRLLPILPKVPLSIWASYRGTVGRLYKIPYDLDKLYKDFNIR